MRRLVACVTTIAVAAALAGCSPSSGGGSADGGAAPSGSTGGAAGSTQPAGKPDPYVEITADGPHERAARAAVPACLAEAQKASKDAGMKVADLANATPRLVAYVVYARVGQRGVLFEVRADGRAYELYKYPAEPDVGALFWQDVATAEGMYTAEPEGDSEKAAAAAVKAVVEQAAPGEAATILMADYTFYWVDANGDVVTDEDSGPVNISITPKGTLGSWSV